MTAFGGIGAQMPAYAGLLIFFSMASLGLPSLSGFISEFLTLVGTYQVHKVGTALACIGIILAAAYLLFMIQRVLLGPLNSKWNKLSDINFREVFTLVPLAIPIVLLGICPKIMLELISPTVKALLANVGGIVR